MKTYVITLAKTFPAWHPRKGEPTEFLEKFLNGQTDRYTTRRLTNIFFEERNGETVFVFRLEPLENN